MIGGIFETIGKTLGIGKEKYFLELDDAAEEVASKVQKAAASAVETAKDVSSDVVETIQSKSDDAGSAANKAKADAKNKAEKVDKAASKAGKAAADKADKAASKADKKAAKFNKKANKLIKDGDAKVKVEADEETGEIKATAIETDKGSKPSDKSAQQVISNDQPEASAPQASRDPEDIIREAIAKTEKAPDGKPVDPEAADTFSTDYLMPLGNRGRRRPGPSFSNYKNMARDTNPRLKN
ncbi:MAG: hypothetical protein WA947_17045 [Phormidesmis sp.]